MTTDPDALPDDPDRIAEAFDRIAGRITDDVPPPTTFTWLGDYLDDAPTRGRQRYPTPPYHPVEAARAEKRAAERERREDAARCLDRAEAEGYRYVVRLHRFVPTVGLLWRRRRGALGIVALVLVITVMALVIIGPGWKEALGTCLLGIVGTIVVTKVSRGRST